MATYLATLPISALLTMVVHAESEEEALKLARESLPRLEGQQIAALGEPELTEIIEDDGGCWPARLPAFAENISAYPRKEG